MFKQVILVSLIASIALATSVTFESLSPMWEAWKVQHNKAYEAKEEALRLTIFADNIARIERLNTEHEHAKFAVNKFADLTAAEFKSTYASCGLYESEPNYAEEDYAHFDTSVEVPETLDWRIEGAVTPVKDQGQCGSCWSFSTTGVIEGFNQIKTGNLVSLSEQQFVDCNVVSDHGCNGGLPSNALTYAAKWGVETEAQYPYKAAQSICKWGPKKATKYVTGFSAVPANNLSAFKAAVARMPVSVGIEADEETFQFYSSGVLTKDCGAQLDHAVLVVGYTVVDGVEAFIVKNSWASTWGQDGYIMISTDDKANDGAGVCGILQMGVVPK